uniref:Uncharacterized protein n=1 Tax=Varanus komodoensis TaxID=61221 RepID=A0A8D2KY48_VARKO
MGQVAAGESKPHCKLLDRESLREGAPPCRPGPARPGPSSPVSAGGGSVMARGATGQVDLLEPTERGPS